MKDKKGIFENEIEEISTGMSDHMIDCHMISLDEADETDEEARSVDLVLEAVRIA